MGGRFVAVALACLLGACPAACSSSGGQGDVARSPSTTQVSGATSSTDPPRTTAVPATRVPATRVPATRVPATAARRSAPSTTAARVATTTAPPPLPAPAPGVRTGAEVAAASGFAALRGRHVALIANQTSQVDGRSLIDVLHATPEVDLVAVMAPEHGVRGTADAGEAVGASVDPATGVRVFSLYGDTRRPTPAMLDGVDLIVFDLQDVGTRYYTYTATMGLAMQAAAEAGIDFMVLDRPDPLGGVRTAGFVRDDEHRSFISQYPIPAVHAMTAGELAQAVKGEGWLSGLDDLRLTVVPMQGWSRAMRWTDTGRPWIPPSPGLQNPGATELYPATVMFEPTGVSHGTGTLDPFTVLGAPWIDGEGLAAELNAQGIPGVSFAPTVFTPRPIEGMAKDPQFNGQELRGVRLTVTDSAAFEPVSAGVVMLAVVQAHATARGRGSIIEDPDSFDLLAGTGRLRRELAAGTPAVDIVRAWQDEVAEFEAVRRRYLLYP